MKSDRPWEMLAEAEGHLYDYLARTGSVDDGLFKALILLRMYNKEFETRVAKAEINEYQPAIH